jgi:hypothetical protein
MALYNTVQDVIDYANTQIQGDNNINSVSGLAFYNAANLDFHSDMIHAEADASEIQEAYRDVTVPAQSPTTQGSTFLYPSDMWVLKKITVNYTDTTEQNYVACTDIKTSNTEENTSFEFLRQNQPTDSPLFEDRGDWFEVFPTFTAGNNLSQALRIFYFLYPTVYTSASQDLVYPETLDPICHAFKLVEYYYDSIQQDDRADRFAKKYKARFDSMLLPTLNRGESGPVVTQMSTGWTGEEF